MAQIVVGFAEKARRADRAIIDALSETLSRRRDGSERETDQARQTDTQLSPTQETHRNQVSTKPDFCPLVAGDFCCSKLVFSRGTHIARNSKGKEYPALIYRPFSVMFENAYQTHLLHLLTQIVGSSNESCLGSARAGTICG